MRYHPTGSNRPAPPLGRHNEEVLSEHGIRAQEIEELRGAGVLV
jgi:crotonobetainyl-CoA:carnitine CoA-transferase CaiB-like acyl-CoA transferase